MTEEKQIQSFQPTDPKDFIVAVYGATEAKNPIVMPIRMWCLIKDSDVLGDEVSYIEGAVNSRPRDKFIRGIVLAEDYAGDNDDLVFLGYAFSQNEIAALHSMFRKSEEDALYE